MDKKYIVIGVGIVILIISMGIKFSNPSNDGDLNDYETYNPPSQEIVSTDNNQTIKDMDLGTLLEEQMLGFIWIIMAITIVSVIFSIFVRNTGELY